MRPEFLDRCHDSIRHVYEYWNMKRGDRAMPTRLDIDPMELRTYLPALMIVEVVPDSRRYVYRLVGTKEVEARGDDPTGQPVGERFFGRTKEKVLFNYDFVVRNRTPRFDDSDFLTAGGRVNDSEELFLPLSGGGDEVTQILVYTHFRNF